MKRGEIENTRSERVRRINNPTSLEKIGRWTSEKLIVFGAPPASDHSGGAIEYSGPAPSVAVHAAFLATVKRHGLESFSTDLPQESVDR